VVQRAPVAFVGDNEDQLVLAEKNLDRRILLRLQVPVIRSNQWFRIDDRYYRTKLFPFLIIVMTETGAKEGAPIITISTGG
jgi:hypothetical protein